MEQIQPYRTQISERFPFASFHVRVPPERVFEVVCATDPALLAARQRHRRTPANFYSSRSEGLLRAPMGQTTWLIDPRQLRRFAGASRLYYAIASYGSPRGDDPRLSTPLDQLHGAPAIDISPDFSGRSLDRSRFGLPLDEPEPSYGAPRDPLVWGGDALAAPDEPTGRERYDDGLDPALWDDGAEDGAPGEPRYGQPVGDARITARLGAFLTGFCNIAVNASSRIAVQPPYFINRDGPRKTRALHERSAATGATAALLADLQRHTSRAMVGKSTPEDLGGILQRVVDGRLAGATVDAAALRGWLVRYGIGVDCSGFVAQALNDLMAMALGRPPRGAELLSITDTPSGALRAGNRGFTQVQRPSDLRPGDTMWKTGHIRIVREVEVHTDGSVELQTAESSSVNDIGPTGNRWRYPRGDRTDGLVKRRGARWVAAGETNVYSRYQPLVTALGAPAAAHGLDDADRPDDAAYGDAGVAQALWTGTPVGRIGWDDADAHPPDPTNGAMSVVEGMQRVPIEGITQGLDTSSRSRGTLERDCAASRVVIAGAPGGRARAVVVCPRSVPRDCDMLLHFHGHNIGVRRPIGDPPSQPFDVARDRVAPQLAAFQDTSPLLAVLPQGTTSSDFGSIANAEDYLDEALGIVAMSIGRGTERTRLRKLVVSAHSGGGPTAHGLVPLDADGRASPRLSGVLLFEAINGPIELGQWTTWVTARLRRDLRELARLQATGEAAQLAYLGSTVAFTGFYTDTGTYATRYTALRDSIANEFRRQLATRDGRALTPRVVERWRRVIRIEEAQALMPTGVRSTHDYILGRGDLLLRGLRNVYAR